MRRFAVGAAVGAILVAASAGSTAAQECHGGQSFGQWLEGVRQEAGAQGISQATLAAAAPHLAYSQEVVNRDRAQKVFAQSFLEFSDRMVAQYRLDIGRQKLQEMASFFSQIEQSYGVPGPAIVAFWGLETDFGQVLGDIPTLRSVASLAYDCRRPDLFRRELLAALRILERGDLTPDRMVGPFAGELGQLQFLPSHYDAYAVDADGDGRRDLLRSSQDALASGAAYMAHLGWRRGEPWLEEVRVSANVPWEEADLAIRHPRAQWAQWGVTYADGSAIPADNLSAVLLLPMGRNGPAFLAYPNFDIYLEWNKSLVYATTAAYYAARLAGAPRVSRGAGGVSPLSYDQVRELQRLLAQKGHAVGKIDGVIGEMTRAAVKAEQQRLGLPADSYPTAEFLQRLRQ